MELTWETIQLSADKQTRTDRMMVIGGWLVKSFSLVQTVNLGAMASDVKVTTNFVADPAHHWVCETPAAMLAPVEPPAPLDQSKSAQKRVAAQKRK